LNTKINEIWLLPGKRERDRKKREYELSFGDRIAKGSSKGMTGLVEQLRILLTEDLRNC
jgi:hypothetical protein